jgi:hypothetical protein
MPVDAKYSVPSIYWGNAACIFMRTSPINFLYMAETEIYQRKDGSKIKRQINLHRLGAIPVPIIRQFPPPPLILITDYL